jgi:drug/metabolite transporter (DMT)-like permease
VRNGKNRGCIDKKTVFVSGLTTGATLFFSYVTQTLGLKTIAAGKAAFITGLSVVLVPIISSFLLRKTPEKASVIGVMSATVGLALMSLELPFHVESGDLLIFLCAIGFAVHILLVGKYSGKTDPVLFSAIQILVVSAGSFVAAVLLEYPILVPREAWGAILGTALFATAFAILAQSSVQRYTTATHTALIFSAEPVFGALFAYLLAGELLTLREILGSACILAGMLVAELGSVSADKSSADSPSKFSVSSPS